MAKVLRLHTTGVNTLQGWDNSAKYSNNVINQIEDPNGGAVQKQITSIPSPFARIDLVKTAFKLVSECSGNNQYKNIEGNTIYNKMVSDSLDVGQLFFEYSKHKNEIDIIAWDKTTHLQELISSGNPALKQLGETYQLYLERDAESNNFNLMQGLYLLNYKNGPKPMNIIGATSPTTLFFSTPNDLSYTNIYFGNDKAFDLTFQPLYKRDVEYHKFLWLLKISTPNFATLFPEFNSYLDACYTLSDNNRKQQLQQLNKGDFSQYQDVLIGGNAGHIVEILGISMKGKKPDTAKIQDSDFVIKSSRSTTKPLVLPVDTFTQPWKYTLDNWNRNTKVPFKNDLPLDQRTLPQVGDQYPYLTISDFLEDTIIKMPDEFNDELYFGGMAEGDNDNCYLLPLKPLFFEFFSVEELQNNKMLRLKNNSGGVSVELTIPTQKGFIQYSRTYFDNSSAQIDTEHNDGAVKELEFAFASLSNIKFANPQMASYRFALLSDSTGSVQYKVNAFTEGKMLQANGVVVRNENDRKYKKCQTYLYEGENVDFIQIEADGKKGIAVPKFVQQNGSDQYTFAVDFGTTNTHVAYSVNGATAKSFDIGENDIQMQYYAKYGIDVQYPFDADFVPKTIGGKSDFHFPMRTTLSVGKNTNWKQAVWPLCHVNVPFTYEKRQKYAYNNVLTNLKWSNDADNVLKIQAYIESLMLLLRNKVILNNGDLAQTKLVWFYPVSMTESRYNNFKNAWTQSYKKYFGNNNLVSMTESIAPYEFFKARFGTASTVLVDIGGGTSDAVIAKNGEIKCITSFRFAANSIFGSGYSLQGAAQLNGIVKQFKDEMLAVLEQSQSSDVLQLLNVFNDLESTNNSADIASFFFSLYDNSKIIENGIQQQLDFNNKLALDDKQKIVFLLFYTAIIYHVAHIMKAKNLGMPRKLAFSGNGSKVVFVVTSDNSLLSRYSQLIFEKVFKEPYPADGLDIETDSNPKEATCRGGIVNPQDQNYMSVAAKKVVLKSTDNSSFVSNESYKSINNKEYVSKTAEQVKKFIDFFFELDKQNGITFTGSFGISQDSINIAKEVCYKDLQDFTQDGLNQKLQEVSEQDYIEESLFFYPLVGVLNALSTAIFNNNNK